MTFEELLAISPGLETCTRHMPSHIKQRFTLRRYPPNTIIHQKGSALTGFGIVCQGQHRVLNEFENGNIFMIEKNSAISFVGEVTLLAGYVESSVSIETITECLVMFISLADFEEWVSQDIAFLRRMAQDISRKLYCTSSSQGERQYYSVRYLVLKYLMTQANGKRPRQETPLLVAKTRQQMSEELGLTIKTLNRTITSLKDSGLIDLQKGKVALMATHLAQMEKACLQYVRQNKRGAAHTAE